MVQAIKRLREAADDLERRANKIADRSKRTDLIDISVKWHSLAHQVTTLYEKAKELEAA